MKKLTSFAFALAFLLMATAVTPSVSAYMEPDPCMDCSDSSGGGGGNPYYPSCKDDIFKKTCS